MILLAKSALTTMTQPTEADIRRVLSSNLSRCTGYVKMIEAVKAVATGTGEETRRG
jgi:aerobic-type carbon monoxide dehydrogenase small subunit (CoxS/CutS family)